MAERKASERCYRKALKISPDVIKAERSRCLTLFSDGLRNAEGDFGGKATLRSLTLVSESSVAAGHTCTPQYQHSHAQARYRSPAAACSPVP